ncbi:MAG: formylglycine-generating enzyme family protein [Verrucomicrobia bacterium]|nr:formylglycine-generating enzyme family protein [Verrucomicrobiota bacterium]
MVLWIGIHLPQETELVKEAMEYDGPKPASVELVSSYDVSEDETSTLTEKEISLPEIGENWTVQLPKDTTLEMVYIPPGTFEMGNPVNNGDKLFDEKQHKVTLTKGFWIGKYEVTQKQWKSILRLEKKQCNGYGDDCPVHRVNWYEANEFCRRLNQREIKAGRLPRNYRYVLPTEAQWEYACRAGTKTELNNGKDFTGVYKERFHGFGETLAELGFSFGNGKWTDCPNLDEVAWCSNNSNNRVHPVGQKKPNAWGLYDMHGNISEWCVDKYIARYPKQTVDPIGSYPVKKSLLDDFGSRILRGGCFSSGRCSLSQRHTNDPGVGFSYIGFRLALVYFDREEDIKPENLQVRFAGVADLEPIYDDEGNLKPKYKQPEPNEPQN